MVVFVVICVVLMRAAANGVNDDGIRRRSASSLSLAAVAHLIVGATGLGLAVSTRHVSDSVSLSAIAVRNRSGQTSVIPNILLAWLFTLLSVGPITYLIPNLSH